METNVSSQQSIQFVQAEYRETGIVAFDSNPFIEALPPILSMEQTYRALKHSIPYQETDRLQSPEIRLHMVYHAKNFFKPYSRVIQLASSISIAIREGYSLNPLSREYWHNLYKIRDGGKIHQYKSRTNQFGKAQSGHLTMIGISGSGKSYATENCLRLYPQVIKHKKYHDTPFLFYQVVWIKINCPIDGTVKGFCLSTLRAFDSILGTNYFQEYGRNGKASKDELKDHIRSLVYIHGLGCLVADEIQNLTAAKGKDKDELINFFVDLENIDGLPIIKVGTYKARQLFGAFREARRASGLMPPYWDQMDNDQEWADFIDTLWKYQYTAQSTPLTKEIINVIYDISQGVLDFAVKAYLFSQFRAIFNKTEVITPELLYSVAKDHFQPANKILNALRNHDLNTLMDCEDVFIDFDKIYTTIVGDAYRQTAIELHKESVIESQTRETPNSQSNNIVKNKKQKKEYQNAETLADDDLRCIAEKAREKGVSAYDALKKAGYIKPLTEFLD